MTRNRSTSKSSRGGQPHRARSPEFDVAISYASEDHSFVEGVVARLKREKDLKVFYAPDFQSHLWGKDEHEFERIYGGGARVVVPFVSKDYVRKEWPRREFRAARRAAKDRAYESILPVRIDDAALAGLRRTVQYISAKHFTPEAVAEQLVKKLRELPGRTERAVVAKPQDIVRLAGPTREALGLLVTSPMPPDREWLTDLFPGINWTKELGVLRRLHVIPKDARDLRVAAAAERAIAERDQRAFRRRWVTALTPLAEHSDAALLLALEYMALEKWPHAILSLVEIAEGLEPGGWNDFYLSLLQSLDQPKLIRKLSPHDRLKFRNALGLTLARAGHHEEARQAFEELRTASERLADAWGIGQAFINGGVAAYRAGDEHSAVAAYESAIEHARATSDDILLGRSLSNLAQTIVSEDPERAERLLGEAELVKERADDVSGKVGTSLARGDFAMERDDVTSALRHYERAAAGAAEHDLRYLGAVARRCVGKAQADLGEFPEAFRSFAEARRIVKAEEYTDQQLPLAVAEALARVAAKHYRRAEKKFLDVASLQVERGDTVSAAIARHDAGVSALHDGRPDDARALLLRARDEAARAGDRIWAAQCALDAAIATDDRAEHRSILRSATKFAAASDNQDLQVEIARYAAAAAFEAKDFAAADRELMRALSLSSDPAVRAGLAVDRFYIAVDANWSRRAEARYDDARAIAANVDDASYLVDLNAAVGDWLWDSGGTKRKAAAEAYTAAMLEALKIDVDSAIQVASHFIRRLVFSTEPERASFRNAVRSWIVQQDGAEGLLDFVTWPFDAAEPIALIVAADRVPTSALITTALTDAFEKAIASVHSKSDTAP